MTRDSNTGVGISVYSMYRKRKKEDRWGHVDISYLTGRRTELDS